MNIEIVDIDWSKSAVEPGVYLTTKLKEQLFVFDWGEYEKLKKGTVFDMWINYKMENGNINEELIGTFKKT